MPFEKGREKTGGMQKGYKFPQAGRSMAFAIIDELCAEVGTQELFKAALEKHLKEDPLAFYREFVVALVPKESQILAVGAWAEKTPGEIAEMMTRNTIGKTPDV